MWWKIHFIYGKCEEFDHLKKYLIHSICRSFYASLHKTFFHVWNITALYVKHSDSTNTERAFSEYGGLLTHTNEILVLFKLMTKHLFIYNTKHLFIIKCGQDITLCLNPEFVAIQQHHKLTFKLSSYGQSKNVHLSF